jgi:plastocyanin domain-containing protein
MSKKYMLLTFLLVIILAGIFIVKPLMNNETATLNTATAEDLGDYQKVVLSIKNGNYYPNTVTVQSGKPVRIYMDNSVSGCYRSLVIPAFNVRKSLSTSNDYAEFTPTKAGSYGFACSMSMGTGKIIVS